MRVFRDLEIVEHLGSGVPRILKAYGRDAFEIRDSYVRIIFRFDPSVVKRAGIGHSANEEKTSEKGSPKSSPKGSPESSPKTAERILGLIKEDSFITTEQMGELLGITKRAVIKQTNRLQEDGRLRCVGPAKEGRWEVLDTNN